MNYRKAINELNRIAATELGTARPKRHRHDWTSRNKLKRGETVTFYCRTCDKTKQVFFPLLPEGESKQP